MVRVSRYQAPRYLTTGDAVGVMDTDRVIECHNFYGRTRPLVVAHRGTVLSQLVPWRSAERLELDMLEFDANSNDWGMATMTGATDTQSRFVIPGGAGGWWLVSAFLQVPEPSSGTTTSTVYRLEICKVPKYSGCRDYQGAQIEHAREDGMVLGTTDTHCNLASGTIMWCDEGDEVFARAYQGSGTDITIAGSSGGNSEPDCQISMVWLGLGDGPVGAAGNFVSPSSRISGTTPTAAHWTEIADAAFYVTGGRPTVKVGKDTGTSVATGSQVIIGMNSEGAVGPFADVWAWHSTVTNNSRVTIGTGQGGLYLVGASLAAPHLTTATCRRALDVRLNGATNLVREDLRQTFTGVTAGPVMSCGPNLVQLAAGDYVEVTYFQDSGGTLSNVGDDNVESNLQPANGQLYVHQVQEGTLSTATSFTANGYQACNTVLTNTWWNTYLANNPIALVKDVRACSVKTSGTTSVASGSWVSVSFGTEEFDNGGYWSAGAPTQIIIPSGLDGWYLVGGQLNISVTGATRRMGAIRIQKSTTTTVAKRGVTVESATFCTLCIPATLVHCAAGDTIELQARHNVGSSINVGGSGARYEGNLWALYVCSGAAYDPA